MTDALVPELVSPLTITSCRHCGQACDDRYRCSECEGAVICDACAREGGLFGLEAILRERAQAEKRAWMKRTEEKWQQRELEARLLRHHAGIR